jgi:hypothetical protein
MATENEVSIEYQGKEETLDIDDDLNPESLKELFGLSFTPMFVKHKTSLKNIKIERREKFTPGK